MTIKRAAVFTLNLDEIQGNAENPREIDEAGKCILAASLRRFGMVDVLVVNREADTGVLRLLSGHQRLAALLSAGVQTSVCMVVEADQTDATEIALLLNGHHGKWDQILLEGLLRDLAAGGDDLAEIPLAGQSGYDDALEALKQQAENDEHSISIGATTPPAVDDPDTVFNIDGDTYPIPRPRYMAWRGTLQALGFFNDIEACLEIKQRMLA